MMVQIVHQTAHNLSQDAEVVAVRALQITLALERTVQATVHLLPAAIHLSLPIHVLQLLKKVKAAVEIKTLEIVMILYRPAVHLIHTQSIAQVSNMTLRVMANLN